MKKLLLIGLLASVASPVLADDDQATTIAKMQAQLNGLAEQNRTLNGKVEDLQHQLTTPGAPAPAQAAPLPYGVPVPIPQGQPVAEMPPPPPPAPQPYSQQTPISLPANAGNEQITIPANAPPAPAFTRIENVAPPTQPVPYTPPLQGEAVISPKLEQPTVIGADGSAITKPNPYVTKVTPAQPALAPLPAAQPDEDTLEDEFDKVFQSVSNEDYATAKPALKGFIQKHPGTDLAGEAYFWLGEIAMSEKNYNEAVVNYLKGYKEAPTGEKAPENILKMSLVLKQLGKNADACKYIARFNSEFPDAHPDLKMKAANARADLGCK